MPLLVRSNSIAFYVVGDGTSLTISIPLNSFPFPERTPGKPIGVTNLSGAAGVSFTNNDCIISFNTAFTGQTAVGFSIDYLTE